MAIEFRVTLLSPALTPSWKAVTVADFLPLALVHSLEIVLAEGSFRQAAERLHVSPPAITQQIKRLEETVGYALVDRSQHPVQLTERGARFMIHAREALEASRRAMGTDGQARLRIGFISGYPRGLDEDFLVRFRSAHPDVQLEFVQLGWGEQASRLLAGDIDAVLARRPFGHGHELDAIVVHREARIVALAAGSPLADRASLRLADIAALPVLRASATSAEWNNYWSVDPRPDGTPVTYSGWAHTMEEALTAVAVSGNIIITAESIGVRFTHPGVRYVEVTDAPRCAVELCTRRIDRRPIIRALREAAAAVPV